MASALHIRSTRWLAAALSVASGVLAGCVGYDGGSDGASLHAQSLGLTVDEESSIRGALAQQALSAEEIARLEKDLDGESGLPTEWKTQSSVTSSATKFKSQGVYEACTSDINCQSLHCAQANVCLPAWRFKEAGERAFYAFECRTSRVRTERVCAARYIWGACKRYENIQVCDATVQTDADGVKNAGETDVDCGGSSLYRCPVGRSCSRSDDCAIGVCDATSKTCQARGAGLVDIGRFWKEPAPPDRPYATVVRIAPELSDTEQVRAVQAARRPDVGGALSAAENQFAYQHDTCVKHLLANDCSPIAIETRIHREAFQNVICQRSRRAAIGIMSHAEVTDHVFDVGLEAELGRKSLSADPFLCNHSFTRAASVISHTQEQPWGYIRDTRPAPFSGYWAGAGLMSNEGIWDGTQCADGTRCGNAAKKEEALKWPLQVEQLLLAGAACSKGRVIAWSGGPRPGPTSQGGFDARSFCRRFQGEEPVRAGALPSAASDLSSAPPLSPAEWNFIRMNVPWWNDYDIYSIDPEGNPYRETNRNMQYGWDAAHPGMSFATYASSYGASVTLGTGANARVYGQTTNGSWSAFNWNASY